MPKMSCLLSIVIVFVLLLGIFAAIIRKFDPFPGSGGDNWLESAKIVQYAGEMAENLQAGGQYGYDVVMGANFPEGALSFWDSVCGQVGCARSLSGNLECGVFVGMAYGWAGLPLVPARVMFDWWGDYANGKQPGWIEIPNGIGMPELGDILVLNTPTNGPFAGEGHGGIVVALQQPSRGNNGTLTFAEANGPTPFVTWRLDANGTLVSAWANYTVMGFIRHISPLTSTQSTLAGLPNSPYVAVAWQDAQQAGITPAIFVRQINRESGFNPNAKSTAGAEGIAQFLPSTAATLGIDPWNPAQALQAAAQLMAGYVRQYGGDYQKALAAYNAGPEQLQSALNACGNAWLSCMPQETQQYVTAILSS